MHESRFQEITASGRAAERGQSFGRQMREAILAFHRDDLFGYYQRHGVGADAVLAFGQSCRPFLAEHVPALLAEVEGMCAEVSLPVEQAVACLCHEEIFHMRVPCPGHCIIFAVACGETGTGRCCTGQTWEWMNGMYGKSFLTHWSDERGFRVLFYSYPGFLAAGGMNQAGLGLTWHSGALWGQNPPLPGIPTYALIYRLLQCRSIGEALAWLEGKPNAGWFNFMLCDASGQIASIEGAPRLMRWIVSRAYMARNKYYHLPELRQASRQEPPGMPLPVWHREGRMLQLLEANLGRMDDAFFQSLLRDHQSGCEIAWPPKAFADADDFMTVDSFYYSPMEGKAHFARGPGIFQSFQEVSL